MNPTPPAKSRPGAGVTPLSQRLVPPDGGAVQDAEVEALLQRPRAIEALAAVSRANPAIGAALRGPVAHDDVARMLRRPGAMDALADLSRADPELAFQVADAALRDPATTQRFEERLQKRRRSSVVGSPGRGLLAHSPRAVHRAMARGSRGVLAREFEAALLFADISGFTRLATQVTVEELKRHINSFFSVLLAVVECHGGDAIKFAGDAVLICWAVGEGESESPAQAARSAALCAMALQERCGHYTAGDDVALRLHSGLGCGPVWAFHVGGAGRSEYLLDGEPLRQIAAAEGEAQAGDSVASPAAWALLRSEGGFTADETEGGNFRLTGHAAPDDVALAEPAPIDMRALPAAELAPFAHVMARGSGELAEQLREVVVLFVSVEPEQVADALELRLSQLQGVMETADGALQEFGGMLRQFIVDDKGTVLIGSFGLVKQEDDCLLALAAAQNIVTRLASQRVRAKVGVTLGPVFCGLVGAASRCEYAIMGPSVNLSARLMASGANEGILCDGAVWRRAGDLWRFKEREAVRAKGYDAPVAVFQPLGRREDAGLLRISAAAGTVVGREAELAALAALLEMDDGQAAATFAVISGAAGVGKTRLLGHAIEAARARGLRVLVSTLSATQQSELCTVWRPVGWQLVKAAVPDAPSPLDAVRLFAREFVPPSTPWQCLAAVLGDTSPEVLRGEAATPIPQSELLTRRVDALMTVLREGLRAEPTLLVIDDVHWLDSMSWRVLDQLADDLPSLVVVATTRPLTEHSVPAVATMLERSACTLHLGRLSAAETLALAQQTAGSGSALDARVGDVLFERTGGNAMFVVALTNAMLSSGLLRPDGTLSGPLQAAALPGSVKDAVVARVDRLSPAAQAVLKAGSVVGPQFDGVLLRLLDPCAGHGHELAPAIHECIAAGVLRRRGAGGGAYMFDHALVCEAVHGLMLEQERQRLHRRLATHLASQGAAEPTVLARHWEEAGDLLNGARCWLDAAVRSDLHSLSSDTTDATSRGLQLLERSVELVGETRAGTDVELQLLRYSVQAALMSHGKVELSQTTRRMDRALSLFKQLDAPDEPTQDAYIVLMLTRIWLVPFDEWRAAAAEYAEAAIASDRPVHRMRERVMRIVTQLADGDFRAMAANARQILDADPIRVHARMVDVTGADRSLAGVAAGAAALLYLGDVDAGLAMLDEALALQQRMSSHVTSRHTVLCAILAGCAHATVLHERAFSTLAQWEQTVKPARLAGSITSSHHALDLVALLFRQRGAALADLADEFLESHGVDDEDKFIQRVVENETRRPRFTDLVLTHFGMYRGELIVRVLLHKGRGEQAASLVDAIVSGSTTLGPTPPRLLALKAAATGSAVLAAEADAGLEKFGLHLLRLEMWVALRDVERVRALLDEHIRCTRPGVEVVEAARALVGAPG